jgi:hypothetical protein
VWLGCHRYCIETHGEHAPPISPVPTISRSPIGEGRHLPSATTAPAAVFLLCLCYTCQKWLVWW